jgi:hypothetical protein
VTYDWRHIDGDFVELCDECGFDAREATDETPLLVAAYAELERLVDHPDADRRPLPETWSANEYVEHCVDASTVLLGYIGLVLDRPGPTDLPDLAACARACEAAVPALSAADRDGVLRDHYQWPVTVQWIVRHLLHDLEHHVLDLRRGYARLAMADHEGGCAFPF